MANHRAAAALLLIASLLGVFASSRSDARPNVHPASDAAAALRGSNTGLTVHDDAHGQDAVEPDCDDPEPEPPTCDTCEEPAEPPTCDCEEPEPELTCNKVHSVKDGETCYSMGQCAGLTLDVFLSFNPNICCDNLFIGQWVCLSATSPCAGAPAPEPTSNTWLNVRHDVP